MCAAIRALEIIDEAAKNIPNPIKARYPQIPWKDMAGMRDKVIYAYFGVDLKRVWNTVNKDIPSLNTLHAFDYGNRVKSHLSQFSGNPNTCTFVN